MRMKASEIFDSIYHSDKRLRVLEGGARSSKTWSIIQFIIAYCLQNKKKQITICRDKSTWLTATVLVDFVEILEMYGLYDVKKHNKSKNIYNLNGNQIWFIGLDEVMKLHGRRQHICWINEAIETKYINFKQLNIRTEELFLLDYNPSETEHWIYSNVIPRKDCDYFHSTMLMNPFLKKAIRQEILNFEPTPENIEQGTADKTSWEIYGLGVRGKPEGLIFKDVNLVKEMPPLNECKKRFFGQDYGFTNDPTALIEIRLAHGQLWFDEWIYERGLTNIKNPAKPEQPSIEQRYEELGVLKTFQIISEIETKSNQDLRNCGYNVHDVKKIKVIDGINILKRYKLNITLRSLNLIKESKNYKWKQLKDGSYTNEPIDAWNHGWDAIRYGCVKNLTLELPAKAVKIKSKFDRSKYYD